MSKRGGGESYSNGKWLNGTEIPSYMANTPPSSNGITLKDTKPKPGRIKRLQPLPKGKKKKSSFLTRLHQKWIVGASSYAKLCLAVLLWYLLGVISIGTTKVLLQDGTPPLWLTLQQLFLGSNLLRFLLHARAMGSAGLQPWPQPSQESPVKRMQRQQDEGNGLFASFPTKDLILAGAFFCFGFLATNYSFQKSSAAFVETVKAAEPITSAATAVAWGIETISYPEALSLATIVLGVLLSTLGNTHGASGTHTTMADNVRTCIIVMTANFCFSFRGSHQKLFRATPMGNQNLMDDLNLQYRMQQIGVGILVVPVVLFDGLSLVRHVWSGISVGSGVYYLGCALVNGFAFTSYNLASTFVLTRISVVHHAALNCLRRIFAVVVTSIMFRIPISFLGTFGIMVSFCGFMSFTHHKAKRQKQPKPISTLLPMSAVSQDDMKSMEPMPVVMSSEYQRERASTY